MPTIEAQAVGIATTLFAFGSSLGCISPIRISFRAAVSLS